MVVMTVLVMVREIEIETLRVMVTWRGPHCNITVDLLESSLPPQTGPVLDY
jgi:hypothetical protein